MCLVVLNWRPDADFPLVLAANRDEFRARPTQPIHWWSNPPVLAGRDLRAGGTWFAIDRSGRFALITNIRPGYVGTTSELSRGQLPIEFLSSAQSIAAFHQRVLADLERYGGFNLILGEPERLFWFSSDQPQGCWLPEGVHVLCNDALNTPWPKSELARRQMAQVTAQLERGELENELLSSTAEFSDELLPSTGVPIEWERRLSAQTILGEEYGTLSRSWLRQSKSGECWVDEAQFDAEGRQTLLNRFHWSLTPE